MGTSPPGVIGPSARTGRPIPAPPGKLPVASPKPGAARRAAPTSSPPPCSPPPNPPPHPAERPAPPSLLPDPPRGTRPTRRRVDRPECRLEPHHRPVERGARLSGARVDEPLPPPGLLTRDLAQARPPPRPCPP